MRKLFLGSDHVVAPELLAEILRGAGTAERRWFRRIVDRDGICRVIRVEWVAAGRTRRAELEVPEPTPEFAGFAFDPEGHAHQRVVVDGEVLVLYPVLDAFSFEHALNVEQVLLPAVLELLRASNDPPEPPGFELFRDGFERIRGGDGFEEEVLPPSFLPVIEALKAEVNDATTEDMLRERMFLRFYQHVVCGTEAYRKKAQSSLAELVARVNEVYISRREDMVASLLEAGFDEQETEARGD